MFNYLWIIWEGVIKRGNWVYKIQLSIQRMTKNLGWGYMHLERNQMEYGGSITQ